MCLQKEDNVDKKLSQEEKELENLKTECTDANAKIQSLHAETESMRALVWIFIFINIYPFIYTDDIWSFLLMKSSKGYSVYWLPAHLNCTIDLCFYLQKRGLENSLNDAKHWHNIELQNLGSVIGKLEAELADVRGDIEQQQCNNETLISKKKRLEIEIEMYHGILDGEENRFQPSV